MRLILRILYLPALYHFQRKFIRESSGAKCDTFKKFREWLEVTYTNGLPTDEEWHAIMDEDEQYEYHLETDILLDEEYDGTQNDAYAYNPAMHSFPNPATDPENVLQ